MMEAETNCPRCNPEAKPRIRRLNKSSLCLICMNTGWTRYDKKCKDCGKDSGIYNFCDDCAGIPTTEIKMTSKWFPVNNWSIKA